MKLINKCILFTILTFSLSAEQCTNSSLEGDAINDIAETEEIDLLDVERESDSGLDSDQSDQIDTSSEYEEVEDIAVEWPSSCTTERKVSTSFNSDLHYIGGIKNLVLSCEVISIVIDEEGIYNFQLDCIDGEGENEAHTFSIDSRPPVDISISEGDEIVLEFLIRGYSFPERWFTFRNLSGDLLLAGIEAYKLTPEDISVETFYEPLMITSIDGLCPVETDYCFDTEKLAVDIDYDESVERVFWGEEGMISSTSGLLTCPWHTVERKHPMGVKIIETRFRLKNGRHRRGK